MVLPPFLFWPTAAVAATAKAAVRCVDFVYILFCFIIRIFVAREKGGGDFLFIGEKVAASKKAAAPLDARVSGLCFSL